MSVQVFGPKFELQTDSVVLIQGNTERRQVGEPLLRTLDRTGLFPRNIEAFTINEAGGRFSPNSRRLRSLFDISLVIGRSAASIYVPNALQILAFNSPEPIPTRLEVLKRGAKVGGDEIEKEPDTYKTGPWDLTKALAQVAVSPITSYRTINAIASGYSTSRRLIEGAEDFPAGRAMVHGMEDGFGFAASAYDHVSELTEAGVTTVWIPEVSHNEILLAPGRVLENLRGNIFPSDMPSLVR